MAGPAGVSPAWPSRSPSPRYSGWMTGLMDAGSRRAAVAVSCATRTAGIRLTWTSSTGMAPSNAVIRSLAPTVLAGIFSALKRRGLGPRVAHGLVERVVRPLFPAVLGEG